MMLLRSKQLTMFLNSTHGLITHTCTHTASTDYLDVHTHAHTYTHTHKDVVVSCDRVPLHIQWSFRYKNSLTANLLNNRKPSIVR